MNRIRILFISILLFTATSNLGAAELAFAGVFTDYAVLQRDASVPVWGWADPREEVTVIFASQTKTTTADSNGKWLISLDSMSASTIGHDMVLQSSKENRKTKITNIVVGDVWLCSGQSNMAFKMNGVEDASTEVAAANHPHIRFFTVKEQFAQSPLDNVKGVWKAVSPTTAAECSAVAYYFAKALQTKVNVPIGLMISSVGGTRIESWMQYETIVSLNESSQLLDQWKNVSPEEFEKIAVTYRAYQYRRDNPKQAPKSDGEKPIEREKPPKMRCHDCPSALYNGMLAPLKSYAIRGMIWYQGESNSNRPLPYLKLQPAFVADSRKTWGNVLPFLFVQLAPHESTSPVFREVQHQLWKQTPHTAMVVTTDVGDPSNIHPKRKGPVGERLALAALAISYGESVEYSSPVFEKMTIDGNRAIISFTHVGRGLTIKGESLTGFVIAGKDGKYIPAHATINGSTVEVTAEKINNPVAVRYGWANVPEGNLFNLDGLPAAPFRTDIPVSPNPAVK